MGLPVTATPKFVLLGFEKPGGGVRLYASRSFPMKAPRFWLADEYGGTPGPAMWKLEAELDHMLIIDKATWNEALAHAFTIWANEDAAAAQAHTKPIGAAQQLAGRKAIPSADSNRSSPGGRNTR
jgi:hypothetical protein